MESKQFHFQYTVCVLNKVILNTINRPRRGAQRKTSFVYSRTYVAVFRQRRISLVQAWLASLFMRSSRSPSLLELYVRPNLSSLRLIHSVLSHLIRRHASELDQHSLEFCAKCRSAVYLVNLTVCLAQNRDWVGKLLRIIGLSLRSYWDTGDRQYVVVSLHCTSLLSLPAIRKDCRAIDIFHEAEKKCVTPWTRVDGNNSKQTTYFRACVTVLVTSRLRWLWTVSALFFGAYAVPCPTGAHRRFHGLLHFV
jgi:hypothetical protein